MGGGLLHTKFHNYTAAVVLYNPQPKVIDTEAVCSVASDSTAVKSSTCLPSLGNRLGLAICVFKSLFFFPEAIWDAQVMSSSIREYLRALTILREKDEIYRVLQMTKPISLHLARAGHLVGALTPAVKILVQGLDHVRHPTWDIFPPGPFMEDFLTPKCS